MERARAVVVGLTLLGSTACNAFCSHVNYHAKAAELIARGFLHTTQIALEEYRAVCGTYPLELSALGPLAEGAVPSCGALDVIERIASQHFEAEDVSAYHIDRATWRSIVGESYGGYRYEYTPQRGSGELPHYGSYLLTARPVRDGLLATYCVTPGQRAKETALHRLRLDLPF